MLKGLVILRAWLWVALLGILSLVACSSSAGSESLRDEIREYVYDCQPTTGTQFVEWANQNLSGYSPAQVNSALRTEAEYQVSKGHPNVIGVLSFCARDWAKEKGLRYDAMPWKTWQEAAKKNMRQSGDLTILGR